MSSFRRRIGFFLIACLLMLAGAWLVVGGWGTRAPRRHGTDAEFAPQVYIWQRSWSPELRAAAAGECPAFARSVVLARQIAWEQDQPKMTRVGVDWRALKDAGVELGAALRVNPYSGNFAAQSQTIAQSVRSIIDDAAASGVKLAEVQIDFDAATSRLADYRQWLAAARAAASPIPVSFTALPTWLNSAAFTPLARDAGYFVLQVHWLDRPKTISDPLPLCDIPTARRALEKAGRIGVPFRVALPTYSYVAAFSADGTFAGLVAEDAPADWGRGKTLRLISAQPGELAQFVNQLAADRPMSMLGVIWYRLPIASDRLNWAWPTLEAVMNGNVPAPGKLSVACRPEADGAQDIVLTNTGGQECATDAVFTLKWSGTPLVAADALAGFRIVDKDQEMLRLRGAGGWQSRLKPGEIQTIGWLRLGQEVPIHGIVEQQ